MFPPAPKTVAIAITLESNKTTIETRPERFMAA
jgi:hypothetical protein